MSLVVVVLLLVAALIKKKLKFMSFQCFESALAPFKTRLSRALSRSTDG